MIKEIKTNAEVRMKKSLEALKNDLGKLRTGRAHTGLLDHVMVEYYGNKVPLPQVASVTLLDARTLNVAPWEKQMLQPVDKAIRESDLGLNPTSSSDSLRVPMPALSEERRRELIKVAKGESEQTKVAVRNLRRDANNALKEASKAKTISQDDERRTEDEIQKMTDRFIAEVDKMLAAKEEELLAV